MSKSTAIKLSLLALLTSLSLGTIAGTSSTPYVPSAFDLYSKPVIQPSSVERPVTAVSPGVKETRVVVHFDFNKADLSALGLTALTGVAAHLESKPDTEVLIEGSTDAAGSEAFNRTLGAKRAEVVRLELIKLGASPDKLKAVSLGKSKPVLNSAKKAAANRRTEISFN